MRMSKEQKIKLLSKLLSNIIKHPDQSKYRNINKKRITQKLGDDPDKVFIAFIFSAGFQLNNNNSRLILDKQHIHKAQNVYNQIIKKSNKNIISNNSSKLVNIINDFNHILYSHNNDEYHEQIYQEIGKCDILKCMIMSRYYKNRDINHCNSNLNKETVHYQIIDKIHCHFAHSYDIGYRLTLKERQQINDDNKNNDIDIDNILTKQIPLNKINKIMEPKKKICKKYIKVESLNKFNQLKAPNDINHYSFGQRFYYWPSFKYNLDPDPADNVGYRINDWYIDPKYSSLKEELMKNQIATISTEQWNIEYIKAAIKSNTDYFKTLVASSPNDVGKMNSNDLISVYNILPGSLMTFDHLISIIVYCSYTDLCTKFSQTFRNNKPSKKSLTEQAYRNNAFKQTHRNFYYLAKHIIEAANIYSAAAIDNNVKCFYHGISAQMRFSSMFCSMFQPFSTSISWEVALNFSTQNGMILELNTNPTVRFFDCKWLSNFSNEGELLFISSKFQHIQKYPLTIKNITNVRLGPDYRLNIEALSIINSFISGSSYASDNTVIFKIAKIAQQFHKGTTSMLLQNCKSMNELLDPIKYDAKPIRPAIKLLTIKLIKHELNRYLPKQYHKMKNIDHYIENLLHHICLQQIDEISIEIPYFNSDILPQISKGGYQGYLFLKYLFYEKDFDVPKIDLISLLFPNVKVLWIRNLDALTTLFIEYMFKYVQKVSSNVKGIIIQFKRYSLDLSMLLEWKTMFHNVGWKIMLTNNNEFMMGNLLN